VGHYLRAFERARAAILLTLLDACYVTRACHPNPNAGLLGDEDERFKLYHYEAPDGSGSGLWIDLRWSLKRELYTAFRSNALDDGETWVPFARPIRHHAVAKRQAFEAIAWSSVPLASSA
jgi:hypothetical protein